jgi:hypothetical protein
MNSHKNALLPPTTCAAIEAWRRQPHPGKRSPPKSAFLRPRSAVFCVG